MIPNYHMPYCPHNPDFQHYVDWKNDLEEDNRSYLENYVSKRLKQNAKASAIYPRANLSQNDNAKLNSSWPTLAWSTEQYRKANQMNQEESCSDISEDEVSDGMKETESEDSKCNVLRSTITMLAQCCIQFWYCFTANEEYKREMKRRRTPNNDGMTAVNSVSKIDKVSRICFPLVFFVLNASYWSFYINERNADFNQWDGVSLST